MSGWLSELADAAMRLLGGPSGDVPAKIGNSAEATAETVLAEWREMRLPADLAAAGEDRVVEGIDVVQLALDVEAFTIATPEQREARRPALMRRLDLVLPPLSGDARGYFAMAREVVRRL